MPFVYEIDSPGVCSPRAERKDRWSNRSVRYPPGSIRRIIKAVIIWCGRFGVLISPADMTTVVAQSEALSACGGRERNAPQRSA